MDTTVHVDPVLGTPDRPGLGARGALPPPDEDQPRRHGRRPTLDARLYMRPVAAPRGSSRRQASRRQRGAAAVIVVASPDYQPEARRCDNGDPPPEASDPAPGTPDPPARGPVAAMAGAAPPTGWERPE